MGKKHISHQLTLKESYIVKHALRDKPDKDADEIKVYDEICENIQLFKDKYSIPSPLPVKKKRNENDKMNTWLNGL